MGIDSSTSNPLFQIYMDEPNSYANPYMRMAKSSYSDDSTAGFFLGFVEPTGATGPTTGDVKFNIGDNTSYLKWTGSSLDLLGDIGGTIGQISISGSTTGAGITITEDGITGSDGTDDTFVLTKDGDLTLIGTITATAGDIGG